MWVAPAIDKHQMGSRLARAIADAGHVSEGMPRTIDHEAFAKAAGLDPVVVFDALRGSASTETIDAIAKTLGMERAGIAPLHNIRDPDRRDRLPPEGRDVPDTDFWRHALRHGDVMRSTDPDAAPQPEAAATEQQNGRSRRGATTDQPAADTAAS